jgi:hypothetical protein
MATTEKQLTDDEFDYIEVAFQEFKEHGATEKRCPWCSSELVFFDGGTGHSIRCSACSLSETVRGI